MSDLTRDNEIQRKEQVMLDIDTFAKILFDNETQEQFIKECESIGIVYESDCTWCDHFYECETTEGYKCPKEEGSE